MLAGDQSGDVKFLSDLLANKSRRALDKIMVKTQNDWD